MTHRIVVAGLMAVAVVFLGWGISAQADDKKEEMIHKGHIVKVADDKLTMVGEDKKEVTHPVPKDATVTLDGKEAKLEDLKAHTQVKVTMKVVESKHVVTKVEAETSKK